VKRKRRGWRGGWGHRRIKGFVQLGGDLTQSVGVLLLGFRVSDKRYGSVLHTNSTCRHVAGTERASERVREERERSRNGNLDNEGAWREAAKLLSVLSGMKRRSWFCDRFLVRFERNAGGRGRGRRVRATTRCMSV
jgi:hypothetical protein